MFVRTHFFRTNNHITTWLAMNLNEWMNNELDLILDTYNSDFYSLFSVLYENVCRYCILFYYNIIPSIYIYLYVTLLLSLFTKCICCQWRKKVFHQTERTINKWMNHCSSIWTLLITFTVTNSSAACFKLLKYVDLNITNTN